MKKIFSILLLAVSYLISVTAAAALPTTIRFAMEATYPPFEYMDASGQIKGIDVDIAKNLCAEMKVQCTFSNQPWDSLIPSLKLGKFDAIMSALTITDARKQQVDFTEPYFLTTANFLVPSKSTLVISPEGLKGKTIGVQGATTFEQYLMATYGSSVKVKTYANTQDAFLDLSAGRIDVVLVDTPIIADWLKNHDSKQEYKITGATVNDPKFFAGYGIAVQKGNTELLNALNQALAKSKSDGSYQKIIDSYLPANK